jgi:hypothetical protein
MGINNKVGTCNSYKCGDVDIQVLCLEVSDELMKSMKGVVRLPDIDVVGSPVSDGFDDLLKGWREELAGFQANPGICKTMDSRTAMGVSHGRVTALRTCIRELEAFLILRDFNKKVLKQAEELAKFPRRSAELRLDEPIMDEDELEKVRGVKRAESLDETIEIPPGMMEEAWRMLRPVGIGVFKLTVSDMMAGSDSTTHDNTNSVWHEIESYINDYAYIADPAIKEQLTSLMVLGSLDGFIKLYNSSSHLDSNIYLYEATAGPGEDTVAKTVIGNPMDFPKMIVCKICGNKRCPHATDESLECTNSNEPGQKGSRYE